MTIKEILLNNLDDALGDDGMFPPADSLLDKIWAHILKTTDDKPMLMSDVINGDAEIDDLLIALAASGSLEDATKLRERAQELFRDWAYKEIEDYESDVRAALREPPE